MENTTLSARVWKTLSAINVNEHVEKKGNLSYLSWSWAWATLMDHYPESFYEFSDRTFDDGTMEVTCRIMIREGEESVVREMWLPVMDYKNKAIVNPDARSISDSKMRALTKCLAIWGLGHYIYAGEDLPSADKQTADDPITAEQARVIADMIKHSGTDPNQFLAFYKIKFVTELPKSKHDQAYNILADKIAKMEAADAQAEAVEKDAE